MSKVNVVNDFCVSTCLKERERETVREREIEREIIAK